VTTKPAEIDRDRLTEEEIADDAVIGRAFVASLVVIAILAALGAGAYGLYVLFAGAEPPPSDPVPVGAPIRQATIEPDRLPALPFTDITEAAGIDFVHVNGARGEKLLPETMGSGCAFLDYDADGDQDLLLLCADLWPDDPAYATGRPTMALYANDGAGSFTNVTRDAGLDISLYAMGATVADFDNDSDPDIFITAVGANKLLRNDGARFTDITAEAGVAGDPDQWSSGAAFFDADADGDLDLFVCNYITWSRELDLQQGFMLTGVGRAYGPPMSFAGSAPYLYLNNADGTFTDASADSGVQIMNPATGLPMAKSLAVAPVDIDDDDDIDLIVANDTVQNFVFINDGRGHFTEEGASLGIAFDPYGKARGAMGIDTAHYRNDDDLAVGIGNFANEMTALYVARAGSGIITDDAIVEGIGPASRLRLTFGLFFFDADLDGRLDLFQTNGHLEEEISTVQASQSYRQPAQLFWNAGPDRREGAFVPVPDADVGDLATPIVGRAAAYADIDADGDLDVVLTQVAGRPLLLRNDQSTGNHYLRLRLEGTASNRDAIGARIFARVGDRTIRQQVMPTRSYLSSVEPVVTIGLGAEEAVDQLVIRWPDASQTVLEHVAADQMMTIRQPPPGNEDGG
jgi:hypothetical protein